MGLISKVLYLKETKDLIEDGLKNVGANITEYDTFRSYPDIVDDLYNNWPRVTATGESASLEQTMEAPLNIDLKGNTSQTGTPTPSSPIRVNTVNGDNTITITNSDSSESQIYDITLCGRNLFDGEIELGSINPSDGSLSSSTSRTRSKNFIKVRPNTTYCLKRSTGINRWVIGYTSAKTGITDGGFNGYASAIQSSGSIPIPIVFTTTPTTQYIKWYDTGSTDLTENVMIELGSTPTNYEAYNTIELCKIGTYQDYIYKDSGNWYLHKEIGKYTFTGNETISGPNTDGGTSGVSGRFYVDCGLTNFVGTAIDLKCNRFIAGSTYGNDNTVIQIANSGQVFIRINFNNYDINTSTKLKTFFTNNNTNLYYQLSTPTETEITNTTLINQLEQLKGAMSYEGQTNISQVNNDLPFILSIEALKGSAE